MVVTDFLALIGPPVSFGQSWQTLRLHTAQSICENLIYLLLTKMSPMRKMRKMDDDTTVKPVMLHQNCLFQLDFMVQYFGCFANFGQSVSNGQPIVFHGTISQLLFLRLVLLGRRFTVTSAYSHDDLLL